MRGESREKERRKGNVRRIVPQLEWGEFNILQSKRTPNIRELKKNVLEENSRGFR